MRGLNTHGHTIREYRKILRAREKLHRLRHPDTARARARRYRMSAKGRATRKAYRRRNPATPEQNVATAARRRARFNGAQIGDSKAILNWMRAVRQQSSFTCYLCQMVKPRSELQFDHVIALVRGGTHSLGNMAASCGSCNHSKNSRLPHEWDRPVQRILSL